MKHIYYISIIGFAVLAFSVVTLAAEKPLPEPWKLEINPGLSEIVCNEALEVVVQVKNISKKQVETSDGILSGVEILVGFEREPFKYRIRSIFANFHEWESRMVQPNESLSSEELVFFSLPRMVMVLPL